MDTDTLIALVSSLLSVPVSHESIIDALIANDGSVEAAAQSLSSKRKREPCLDDWLTKTRPRLESESSSSSSTKSASTSKPPTETKKSKPPPRLPPLMLSNPTMVADNAPCTLHYSVLPPDLACSLFYRMCKLSKSWKRNKWWLFDRIVESPHLTSFFARNSTGLDTDEEWQNAARHWYNGRPTDPPLSFPKEMESACRIIEDIVQSELSKRPRFPLEYAPSTTSTTTTTGTSSATNSSGDTTTWRANVAASNRYLGSDESVGFHSDQLTGIGPYATIASLSLGVKRNFTLREVIPKSEKDVRSARTFNVPLVHNSLIIMHASCQERFKHSVPPQPTIDLFHPPFPDSDSDSEPDGADADSESQYTKTRINITFRFYRPDFRPSSIPKCHCGIPTILRPDMKNRNDGNDKQDKYWWACYAGAQNDGKGCKFWKVMDFDAEGRGPAVKDLPNLD